MAEPAAPPPSWLATLLGNHVAVAALAATLGAGVLPVWTELVAWRKGVAANQLQLVAEQQRLWERNLECIQEQGSYEVDGPHGITARVILCPATGDLLVRYHVRDFTPIYRWVALPVEKVTK